MLNNEQRELLAYRLRDMTRDAQDQDDRTLWPLIVDYLWDQFTQHADTEGRGPTDTTETVDQQGQRLATETAAALRIQALEEALTAARERTAYLEGRITFLEGTLNQVADRSQRVIRIARVALRQAPESQHAPQLSDGRPDADGKGLPAGLCYICQEPAAAHNQD